MRQKPLDLEPSANSLAFFGAELRHHRTLAKMSQGVLGERVHYSAALVGQIETGKRMPSQDFATRCDAVLRTGGVLARLWPLVSKETYPSWFRPFGAGTRGHVAAGVHAARYPRPAADRGLLPRTVPRRTTSRPCALS